MSVLPESLFDFFVVFNGGYFLLYNGTGELLEEIHVNDVFGEWEYDAFKVGIDFSKSMERKGIGGFKFFPNEVDGLVPILHEPSGYNLFFDPANHDQVHIFTIDFMVAETFQCNVFKFLKETLMGKRNHELAQLEPSEKIKKAIYGSSYKEALALGDQFFCKDDE